MFYTLLLRFCKDLKDHATKIIDFKKKTMIPLIKEEEDNYNKENITFPNERDSNKTVSIFILKTIYFIFQNMFRSLHTSSSVVQIKSTVNI